MKASLGSGSIRLVTPPRHVIVCGAGVVGASVAYFLALRGVAVTLVERSGVACAASGKSGGFLALDWCDGSPLGPLARASFDLHARLAREIGIDYGYRRVETFMLAARERGGAARRAGLGSRPGDGGPATPSPPPRWARPRPRPRSPPVGSPPRSSTRRASAGPICGSAWSTSWSSGTARSAVSPWAGRCSRP